MWPLRGFNRPTGIDKQMGLIAKGAHIAAKNGPVWCYYKQPHTHAQRTATTTCHVPPPCLYCLATMAIEVEVRGARWICPLGHVLGLGRQWLMYYVGFRR
jgi:hypothetical protein